MARNVVFRERKGRPTLESLVKKGIVRKNDVVTVPMKNVYFQIGFNPNSIPKKLSGEMAGKLGKLNREFVLFIYGNEKMAIQSEGIAGLRIGNRLKIKMKNPRYTVKYTRYLAMLKNGGQEAKKLNTLVTSGKVLLV